MNQVTDLTESRFLNNQTYFEVIPFDLTSLIFSHSSILSLFSLCEKNPSFNSLICSNESFWNKYYILNFGEPYTAIEKVPATLEFFLRGYQMIAKYKTRSSVQKFFDDIYQYIINYENRSTDGMIAIMDYIMKLVKYKSIEDIDEFLSDPRINRNVVRDISNSGILYAVGNRDLNLVKLFLEKGANAYDQSIDLAMQFNYPEIVKVIRIEEMIKSLNTPMTRMQLKQMHGTGWSHPYQP